MMQSGCQGYCLIADNEGVAASFGGAVLRKALDLAAHVPNWTSLEYCTGYGRMLHFVILRDCFLEADKRRWMVVAAYGVTRILAPASDVGRRCVSCVPVHSVWLGRLSSCSCPVSMKFRM